MLYNAIAMYNSFIILVIVNTAGTVERAVYVKHQHSHLAVVLLRKILKIF